MASIGQLYINPTHSRAYRLRAAAALASVRFDEQLMGRDWDMRTEMTKPDKLADFDVPMAPAFRSTDGSVKLTECSAIIDWLGTEYRECGLIPNDRALAAQVRQWMFFAESEVITPLTAVNRANVGLFPHDEGMAQGILGFVDRRLGAVEKTVSKRNFLVGDSLTAADLTVASALHHGFSLKLWQEETLAGKLPSTMAYYRRVLSQLKLAPIYGPLAKS